MLHILNNNPENGPINTTMAILKQITKTSLLIPCEQLYVQSYYYHKQLIMEPNAGENNSMYQLNFDPHIKSPTAYTPINTPTLPLSRPYYLAHPAIDQTAYMDGTYDILITL